MKIAYNPLTADALTVAPSNNDITFDLKGVAIYAKGVKFKGTDTTYSVFKKHTSDDEGGYSGLVPVPSYNENSKNRYLREDGTWENPSLTIGNYVTLDTDQEITGTKTFTKQLKFTVATGTAPFEVTSKTLVTNLNAEISNYINYTSRAAKGDGIAQFCQYDGETDNPTKDWYSHIIMNHNNSNGYYTEIATCFHSDSVYFRRQHAGVTSEWKKFAFIDSDITGNASTADKLKTKIKLWGLDFDGSADVSGTITIGNGLIENKSIIFPGGEYLDGYGNFYLDGTNEILNAFHIFKTNSDGTRTSLFSVSDDNSARSTGTFTAPTFQGNLDGTYVNKLTNYSKATTTGSIAATDSLNTALGKLEFKTDFIYNDLFGTDEDDVINKWHEIVDFVDSVAEGTDITDEFVTRKTDQIITGTKTFASNTFILAGVEQSDIKHATQQFYNWGGYESDNTTPNYTGMYNSLDFQWYDHTWSIGNLRSGTSTTNGFGIGLKKTDNDGNLYFAPAFRITETESYINNNKIWHTENLTKVSQLENDAGYLTSIPSDIYENYLPRHTYTIPAGKSVRITFDNQFNAIIYGRCTLGNGSLILIGNGYGENRIRNSWTQLSNGHISWSVPDSDFYYRTIEIKGKPEHPVDIEILSKVTPTFTEISTLTSPVMDDPVALKSQIPTKTSHLTNDSGFVTGGPYLPLTGGILSNDARNLLILHDTNSSTSYRGAWIKFSSAGSNNYTTIGLNTTTGTFLEHYVGTTPYILKIDNNGVLYFKDNTVLHSKNYSSYALPFYTITSGDCNTMSQGLTTVTAVVSNQEGSNHSAFLTITDIGTPFQLQIPDHSTNYIYKRYKSGSAWSAWSKLSAGYADSAAYATSARSLYTGSIGSGSDSHASALQNYFNNYKTSIPRGSILSLYSNSYGNGSQYMGYFLNGYDDTPYGGFFVAHYDSCYYVGISYGNYNQQTIITSNNIGSQSVNYAEYAQKLQVNDVRSAARSPKYFDDYRVTAWFNDTGTPSSDWYSGIHVKGWHDGYSSWELASYSSTETDNNYDLYFRNGNNDTWGNWKIVLTDSNYTTYLDGRYVKKAGDTMTGGLTINASHNSAPLILKGGLNNYREGLRIMPYGGWSDILLAGSDASETSGTSTNSWFIGNNNGKLYINKGNSSEKGNPRAMGTSMGWTFGNTDLNSYALNTASFICNSWVRTKGSTGWYNEDYGGGWYMIDSTWIRNYNSKQTYLSVSTYPSLVCNAQSGNDTNIRFDLNGSAKGYVGYLKSYGTFLYNLASNKYVYINDSGYFYTQSYINVGAGNEKNASNPPYVWGVNGSDNFMRTYATSSLSVYYASYAGHSSSADYATSAGTANGCYYVYDYNATTTPIYIGFANAGLTSTTASYLAAYGTTSSGARCIKDITATEAKKFIGLGSVQNTAFYRRSTKVNGTSWDMAGTNSSAAFTIYAPTTAGTSGQVLKSTGGTPGWVNQSSLSVGYADSAGNADTVDGYHATDLLREFWTSSPGYDGNTYNSSPILTFSYANNAPYTGVFVDLCSNGYGVMLNTSYYSNSQLAYKRHGTSSDGGMGSWRYLIDNVTIGSQSVNYANSAGNADTTDGVHIEWAGSQAASDTTWIVGWNANGTKLKAVKRADLSVNYATSAGYLKIHDIRGNNYAPNSTSWSQTNIRAWFNSTGTPDGTWWSGITLKGWTNDYNVWLLASTSHNSDYSTKGLFFRTGNGSTWDSWQSVSTARIFTVANSTSVVNFVKSYKKLYAGLWFSREDYAWANSATINVGSYGLDRMRYSAVCVRTGNLNEAYLQSAMLFVPTYSDRKFLYLAQMYTSGTAGSVTTSVKRYADYDTIIQGSSEHVTLIWIGYVLRSSQSVSTWTATKQGGPATFNLTISNAKTNGNLGGNCPGYTILGGICNTRYIGTGNLSAGSTAEAFTRDSGMGDYMVFADGTNIYVKKWRQTNNNNGSARNDELGITGVDDEYGFAITRSFTLYIFGYKNNNL